MILQMWPRLSTSAAPARDPIRAELDFAGPHRSRARGIAAMHHAETPLYTPARAP
jgi:hypothetical protein